MIAFRLLCISYLSRKLLTKMLVHLINTIHESAVCILVGCDQVRAWWSCQIISGWGRRGVRPQKHSFIHSALCCATTTNNLTNFQIWSHILANRLEILRTNVPEFDLRAAGSFIFHFIYLSYKKTQNRQRQKQQSRTEHTCVQLQGLA